MLAQEYHKGTHTLQLTLLQDLLSTNTTAHAKAINGMLREYPESKKLALELQNCQIIDSCGLNFLFSLNKELQSSDIELQLHGANPTVERLIKIIQLTPHSSHA